MDDASTKKTGRLTERALLVKLSLSMWTARKGDKRAEHKVETVYETAPKIGSYRKSLLPKNELLLAVLREGGRIRTDFQAASLPWFDDGTRLVPHDAYGGIMERLRLSRTVWRQKIDELVAGYDQAKTEAKEALGKLYVENEYPFIESLPSLFRLNMSVGPVPEADFRVDSVPLDDMQSISKLAQLKQEIARVRASFGLWTMLCDTLEEMIWKKLTESVFQQLKDSLDRLWLLNFELDEDFANAHTNLKDPKWPLQDKWKKHALDAATHAKQEIFRLEKTLEELEREYRKEVVRLTTEQIFGSA